MTPEEIKNTVRQYIADELYNGKMPADFTDDTKLVSSRMMDSIVTLHMVNHLEEKMGIEFKAHEVSADNLDTVNILTSFLSKKIQAK